MKRINIFKTVFLLTAFLLSYMNISANSYCADIAQFPFANWERGSGENFTASNGWIWNCVGHTVGSDELLINGSTATYLGFLKSPELTDGCKAIHFYYKTGTGVRLKLELMQEGIAVWDSIVTPLKDMSYHEVLIEDLNIIGNFQLIISNPSATSGRGSPQYEIYVKDICLTAYTPPRCDYSDDFDEVRNNNPHDVSFPTPRGWTTDWLTDVMVSNTVDAIMIATPARKDGRNLISPIFADGCNAIHFKYSNGNSVNPSTMKVEIKQEGTTVWDSTITSIISTDYTDFIVENINIDGNCQLVVTSISQNNKQAVIKVKEFCLTANTPAILIPPHNYQLNVPKDATVFVGDKDRNVTVAGNYLTKHYVPFTRQPEVFIAETDTSRIWYYNLQAPKDGDGFSFRVTREGKAPHVGLFKLPRAGTATENDTVLVLTDAMLNMRDAKDIDHDVNNLIGRNVADMFININPQGHLTLPLRTDTAFQLIHTRNWQTINTDCNNYFIEPDFHYTVVDETGAPSNTVITVGDSGLIRPVGAGTAIVLIRYDALLCHHINNGGCGPSPSGVRPDPVFFGASWAENTGVFVVSVEQPAANVKSNMFINDYWNSLAADKVDSINIDAEHDVLYYEASTGGFEFSFKPEGATSVILATPQYADTLAVNGHSPAPEATRLYYGGFGNAGVRANAEGGYTVKLGFGRNIVKLVSASGASYQVITAKPVSYEVRNVSRPGELLQAGDEFAVVFNTLYHPSNKMSGIYNMSAGIQYTGFDTDFPLILGPGQYTFASRAQEYKRTVPADFSGEEMTLTNGVIKVKGFGSFYGEHRKITIQNGVAPNLNASVRTAYFGALPEIKLPIASTTVSIAGAEYDAEREVFVAECGATSLVLTVVPNNTSSTVIIEGEERSTYTANIDAAGFHTLGYSIVAPDGQASERTVKIEKRFNFNDIVVTRWDNTLIINNNPATNGGYSFTEFKWYRDGAEIGTGQFYSAGALKSNRLDSNAEYSAAATTVGGDTLRTCPASITVTRSAEIIASPNPVSYGETVNVDIASDEADKARIEVYTLSGQRLAVKKAEGRITPVAFPYAAGIYLLKVVSGDTAKDFKIIVK